MYQLQFGFLICGILIFTIIWSESKFATYDEFRDIVEQSKRYFINLTPGDLKARNATHEEYYERYLLAYRSLTLVEKIKIISNLPIMPDKLDKKYLIAKLAGGIELDHPHTLGNCIMLTDDVINGKLYPDLTHILAHERVHIYQRYNHKETNKLLSQMGFNITKNTSYNLSLASNPDVFFDYTYKLNNKEYIPKLIYLPDGQQGNYTHGMADVLVSPDGQAYPVQFQPDLFQSQPSEIMAELIARYITQTGTINPKWLKCIKHWLKT